MKLSFSMKYWTKLDWSAACQAASGAKLSGLEIDSVKNPLLTVRNSPTNPELAAAARRRLAAKDLTVPCVGTAADLTAPEAENELSSAVETAANLLVPYVVIHTVCGDSRKVIEKLSPAVALAEKNNVTLLLESTGAMADTKKLVEVLDYCTFEHQKHEFRHLGSSVCGIFMCCMPLLIMKDPEEGRPSLKSPDDATPPRTHERMSLLQSHEVY